MTQTQFAGDLKKIVKPDTHLFQVKSDVGVKEGPVKELHQSLSIHVHWRLLFKNEGEVKILHMSKWW